MAFSIINNFFQKFQILLCTKICVSVDSQPICRWSRLAYGQFSIFFPCVPSHASSAEGMFTAHYALQPFLSSFFHFRFFGLLSRPLLWYIFQLGSRKACLAFGFWILIRFCSREFSSCALLPLLSFFCSVFHLLSLVLIFFCLVFVQYKFFFYHYEF